MAKSEEYKLGPNTYPRGWFVIAESNELGETPLAVSYFGRDFALYRGKDSGNPVLLDAYCGHMGTHLTASTSAVIASDNSHIEGDNIRCPYHGWRYGPDGKVNDIPYHDGPCPRSSTIQSYPVREIMGCIMMWFDEDGLEPQFEPPMLEEWNDPSWVHWDLDHLGEIDMHPIEVIDNMADAQHLGPTHGAPCEYFENEFKDHIIIQRQGGVLASYGCMLMSTTWYTGPGILLSKQEFGGQEIYEIIANTPVSDGKIKVWHGALHKSASAVATEEDRAIAKEVQVGALAAFAADFSVWANKRAATRIIQLKTDGPFNKVRDWYRQFHLEMKDVERHQGANNGKAHVLNMDKPSEEALALGAHFFE
ncbi:3-ketosteroid 9alpha-monooxygenase subunit A [Sinobacterium caligoides]|uniref:3-ketosteroid 9alpha-monooxygenase subunit A n=1 Tax=Sinobacterium caligoides TaxID=933926 RepID=A0A3N2DPY3_9GAMM|nr:Rieske 2Fe-2S domain-containing protein [Sinobacterium caligoides]ROS01891.1 3-ketosteroid 9alpha-monooxygenase subunit A [Sinobacterium caligoides]